MNREITERDIKRLHEVRNHLFTKDENSVSSKLRSFLTDFLHRLSKSKESEWISVEDRMPEDSVIVVAYGNMGVSTCMKGSPHWRLSMTTHWQPLPDAPKKEIKIPTRPASIKTQCDKCGGWLSGAYLLHAKGKECNCSKKEKGKANPPQ